MKRKPTKAIIAENLSKTYWFYEKQAGFAGSVRALFRGKKVLVEAVRGINLEIKPGELVGFIGPNGAGKTTTLKMLAGILHPTSGELEVVGFHPFKREKAFLKNITFITGQRNRLFWDLPAEEYFDFCRVIYEIPPDVYKGNLKHLVELAEIENILNVPQRKLSFGQRKRCELVASLLHDPGVIFLDEPTNAMDLINARKIRHFIKEKRSGGNHTIILTSHIMADISEVCDRVVIINRGEIAFDGNIRDLTHMNNDRKQIRIVFAAACPSEQVEKIGTIMEINGQEVLLEVESDRSAATASYLLANFEVKDISISDPPLEKTIESIYLRNGL